jgi:hypothetical protein
MRTAIQDALDSGAGDPVIVQLLPGTYEVWPAAATDTYPGNNCLNINYSNVTLMGAGRNATTISCKVAGGLDPNTHWEIVHIGATPYVWRGHGIEVKGSTISNFTLRDLRLTGNSPRNLTNYPVWGVAAGQAFPADTVTGENWDITNKGIFVGNGTTRTNTLIEDCEVDSFRGEIVYYGGSSGNQGLVVRRSHLHDSIGSMFSCSGSITVEDCELSYGENAVENTPIGDISIIRRNWVHNNKIGIVITSNASAPGNGDGCCVVADNKIKGHYLGPLWVLGAIRGYRALRNEMADNPQVLVGGAGGGSGPQDITFEDNLSRLEYPGGAASGVYHCFDLNSEPGYPVKNIRIARHRAERSQYVIDLGTQLAWSYGNGIWNATDSFILDDNDFSGGGGAPPDGKDLWLTTETADNLAPVMAFEGINRLTLAPTTGKTYSDYRKVNAERLLTVTVNANVTISDSSTVKLVGGTSFAPGGSGGVITFIRPDGKSAIYEVSRFAY